VQDACDGLAAFEAGLHSGQSRLYRHPFRRNGKNPAAHFLGQLAQIAE
jgi:hypothetical protein